MDGHGVVYDTVFMNGIKRYGIPFNEENSLRVGWLEATETALAGFSATRS